MRILHLINHVRALNGHVHVAVDLACTQAARGETVGLASAGGVFNALLEQRGVTLFPLETGRNAVALFQSFRGWRRIVSTFRPQMVHAHMMTSAVLSWLARPGNGYRLVTTVHNEFARSAILMAVGDCVVGVSQAATESMARRGTPRDRLRTILNGPLDSPRLPGGVPPAQPLDRPAITFLGGLHPRKGVADLIAAFAIVAERIPGARLHLVGAGPPACEALYRKQATQTGHGARILFCGGQRDPRPWLLGSDIFVLASHAEPGGLVVAEARAAGCAIVATDVGGIPEMLDGGRAGLLVSPRRPDLLAAALLRLLENPALLAEYRARAGEGLDRFRVGRMTDDYLNLYRELLPAA